MSSRFAHTRKLLGFYLRLDRLWLPGWIIACVVFAVCFVPMLPSLVTNDAMLKVLEQTMSSPAVVALCGIIYGETYTFGIMYTQMMFLWSAVLVVIMNIFLVNRHTRKDEEEGRLELIRALPVGKAAPLASLAIIVLAANVIIALGTAFCLPLFNIDTIDLAGSLVFGAGIGGIGLIFGALTMLFAQLASTSKSTLGLSFAVLFIAYLVRAIADMSANPLTNPLGFVSPFGLGARTFPYYENLWWPIAVLVLIALVLAVVAFALDLRRNLGAGLLPARHGKPRAGRLLNGQIALHIRLVRGMVIAWVLVLFILGICYGTVFNDIGSLNEGSPMVQAFLGISWSGIDFIDATIGSLIRMMSIITVVPIVFIINRLRVEEKQNRLEQVFSTASSKISALLCYTLMAVVAAIVIQLLSALGMWAGAAATMDSPLALGVFLKSAFNALPPILVFAAITVLLLGVLPRLIPVVWIYVVYAFFVDYVGGFLTISKVFAKLSPFGLVAQYPTEAFAPLPIIVLLVVSVVLSAIGITAYRARDIK